MTILQQQKKKNIKLTRYVYFIQFTLFFFFFFVRKFFYINTLLHHNTTTADRKLPNGDSRARLRTRQCAAIAKTFCSAFTENSKLWRTTIAGLFSSASSARSGKHTYPRAKDVRERKRGSMYVKYRYKWRLFCHLGFYICVYLYFVVRAARAHCISNKCYLIFFFYNFVSFLSYLTYIFF